MGEATRTFAHGTSLESIDDILSIGLNEAAARAASKGGRASSPGSFFTLEVPPQIHLQAAFEFGLRHSDRPAVLLTTMSETVFQRLLWDVSIRVQSVPGADDLTETIFDPASFPLVNAYATRQIMDPFGWR